MVGKKKRNYFIFCHSLSPQSDEELYVERVSGWEKEGIGYHRIGKDGWWVLTDIETGLRCYAAGFENLDLGYEYIQKNKEKIELAKLEEKNINKTKIFQNLIKEYLEKEKINESN